ncbi:MAG: hypothetical protein U0528_13660 [Anaerolineae bacterium]
MVDKTSTPMTAAQYFALPETNQPTELLHGELVMSASPTPQHSRCGYPIGVAC